MSFPDGFLSFGCLHAIIFQVASSSSEPIFTIQTSMPSISTSTTAATTHECSSDGTTFLCSTATESGDEEPVFCPAPTSIPNGLCFTTLTYTLVPTQSANASTATAPAMSSASLSICTTIRAYPCAEQTTAHSSATYALNCLDEEANYVACPSNVTLTPTPTSTNSASSGSQTTSTTLADCFDDAGSTVSCQASRSSTSSIASTSTLSTNATPSTIQRTRSIITQCFNTQGTPTPCPATCETPFETAPGPVIPTATLTLKSEEDASSTSSEKIFRTSPAPIITSFASAPAFLTSGLAKR